MTLKQLLMIPNELVPLWCTSCQRRTTHKFDASFEFVFSTDKAIDPRVTCTACSIPGEPTRPIPLHDSLQATLAHFPADESVKQLLDQVNTCLDTPTFLPPNKPVLLHEQALPKITQDQETQTVSTAPEQHKTTNHFNKDMIAPDTLPDIQTVTHMVQELAALVMSLQSELTTMHSFTNTSFTPSKPHCHPTATGGEGEMRHITKPSKYMVNPNHQPDPPQASPQGQVPTAPDSPGENQSRRARQRAAKQAITARQPAKQFVRIQFEINDLGRTLLKLYYDGRSAHNATRDLLRVIKINSYAVLASKIGNNFLEIYAKQEHQVKIEERLRLHNFEPIQVNPFDLPEFVKHKQATITRQINRLARLYNHAPVQNLKQLVLSGLRTEDATRVQKAATELRAPNQTPNPPGIPKSTDSTPPPLARSSTPDSSTDRPHFSASPDTHNDPSSSEFQVRTGWDPLDTATIPELDGMTAESLAALAELSRELAITPGELFHQLMQDDHSFLENDYPAPFLPEEEDGKLLMQKA